METYVSQNLQMSAEYKFSSEAVNQPVNKFFIKWKQRITWSNLFLSLNGATVFSLVCREPPSPNQPHLSTHLQTWG